MKGFALLSICESDCVTTTNALSWSRWMACLIPAAFGSAPDAHLALEAILEMASNIPDLADQDDAIFICFARAAKADFIVSGDKRLFALKHSRNFTPMVTLSEFISKLDQTHHNPWRLLT